MGEKIWIRISQIQDGGVTILRKFFSKSYIFLNDGFPDKSYFLLLCEMKRKSWSSLKVVETRFPFTRLTALSRQERRPAQYVQVKNKSRWKIIAGEIFFTCFWVLISTHCQDVVEENAELVHKLWIKAKGSVYVCGKVVLRISSPPSLWSSSRRPWHLPPASRLSSLWRWRWLAVFGND